ncbi:TPP-dependent acetoin dehydrogenase complex, E1 component subunit alpha [Liquorilactobacillus satsumensis DSM 16230 = JCM 12392]|uniref:TPP-dependent acetoin dehydrogenase complex, E1 component subunit alpha n=2 Tax=Liquorilactobacillus satsumensis TaxID=259059 RepID=A0A0R1V0A2_9LACO|nr:TPP-dependent acetoin dehydrogenase complex, E1 component subunit alpha [Liquorilactobacillus satsumensis DSM 16230 = JCM 12392]
MAVYEAAGKAIERARKGEGPTLVECRTYRNYGHFEGDEQKYKATTGKESEFAKRDCIKEFREYALAQGLLSEESATEIEENSAADIKHAVKFAEESDIPKPETLYQDVFAD